MKGQTYRKADDCGDEEDDSSCNERSRRDVQGRLVISSLESRWLTIEIDLCICRELLETTTQEMRGDTADRHGAGFC